MTVIKCTISSIVALFISLVIVFVGGMVWILAMVLATVIELLNGLWMLGVRLFDAMFPWDAWKLYFDFGSLINWVSDRALLLADGLNAVWGWALASCS